jgi:hypothetical protein
VRSRGCLVNGNRGEEGTRWLLQRDIGIEWAARLGAVDLGLVGSHLAG